MSVVDTYSAGSTMNYTIAGTATHGGGSCQISMSYDLGATWSVIFSQIGGCLIDGMTTTITIPTDAPSGQALFSWSWFNLLGNREMYQNCAVVTITNGGAGLMADRYPTPFVANAGVNECVTIEATAVVFPNRGTNVVYGGSYASTKPITPAGFTGTNCVGPGANLNSTSSSTADTSDAPSGSSAPSSSAASAPVAAFTSSAVTAVSSASTTSSAATAHTTLWTVPLSNASSTLSVEDVSSSSSATAVSAQASNCKRRKRSHVAGMAKRHERLVRRRVAASKAQHLNGSSSGK